MYEKEKTESRWSISAVDLLHIWILLFGGTHGMMVLEKRSVLVVVWNCPGGALFVTSSMILYSQRVVKLVRNRLDNFSVLLPVYPQASKYCKQLS